MAHSKRGSGLSRRGKGDRSGNDESEEGDTDHPEVMSAGGGLRDALKRTQAFLGEQDRNLRYTALENSRLLFSSDNLLGRTDHDLFEPEDASRLAAIKEKVLHSGEPVRREMVLSIDGGERTFDLTIVPRLGEDGQVDGLTTLAVDVTACQQPVRDADIRSRRSQAVIQTTTDAVMLFDASTLKFCDINPACQELYGYSREELLRMTLLDISTEAEKSLILVRQTLEGQRQVIGRRMHRKKDGTVFPVEISGTLVDEGDRRLLCGIVRDISHRIEAEQTLRQSEEKYRRIFETAADLITSVDATGIIVDCNRRIKDVLGYDRDEVIGQPMARIIHPDSMARAEESLQEILDTGVSYDKEYTMVRKDGRHVEVVINSAGIEKIDGHYRRTICVIHDVTARNKAAAALRESEDFLRTILEAIPDAAWLKDPEGRYLECNRAFRRFHNQKAQDVIGKTDFDIHPPDRAEYFRESDQRAIEAGDTIAVEDHIAFPGEGATTEVEVLKTPVYYSGQNLIGVLGVARDITDRKLAERALRESEKRFYELFMTMNDGVAIYTSVDDGRDFIFRDINPAGERLSKVTREEIVGRSVKDVFPGIEELGLWQVFKRVYRSGQSERLPLTEYSDERISQWVDNTVYKLPTGELVAVYSDFTRFKNLESDLVVASRKLLSEQAALESKSIALKEVLKEIEVEKARISRQIQVNVDNVVSPLLKELNNLAGADQRSLLKALSDALSDITAPFVNDLISAYSELTPGEVRLCNLIRSGLSSKEMAQTLNLSEETIRSSRKRIRRKLKIVGEKVELGSYLQSLTSKSAPD